MKVLPNQPNATGNAVSQTFLSVRQRDWLGHRVHLAAAVLYMAALGINTGPASICFGILTAIAVIRLPRTWMLFPFLLRKDVAGWILTAWAALHAVSLLWSPDVQMGLDELKTFRVVITTLLVWPVVDSAALLITALLIGIASQHVVQLGQALQWIERSPGDGMRLRGMIHPVQTGTLCLMAMMLYLSAVVSARTGWRWLAIAGFFAAALGLIATGSRGPWIAAAITLPVALIILAIRRPFARQSLLYMTGALVLALLITWPFVKAVVNIRVEKALAEVERIREGDYSGDVGYRLASWQAAWELFLDKPILGQGTGGYGSLAIHTSHGEQLKQGTHAHSIMMQTLATTGVLGMFLLATFWGLMLWRAWRIPSNHVFADGVLYALIAWFACALFDDPHMSGQMFGVFATLAALTVTRRSPRCVEPIGSATSPHGGYAAAS